MNKDGPRRVRRKLSRRPTCIMFVL